MKRKDCQRKRDFVDAEVQGALSRQIVVHWLLFTTVAALLALGLQWMSDPFAPLSKHVTETWWIHGPLFLVLVCLLPIFVMDTIKLSNRFTGPIYRLRQVVHRLAQGERAEPLEFRGSDFWQSLARDFNQAIDRLSSADSKQSQPVEEQTQEEAACV